MKGGGGSLCLCSLDLEDFGFFPSSSDIALTSLLFEKDCKVEDWNVIYVGQSSRYDCHAPNQVDMIGGLELYFFSAVKSI